MSDKISLNLTAELCYALSVSEHGRAAINEVYSRNRAKYFACAKASPHRNHPSLKRGRAEHEIAALRALGIFEAGDHGDIRRVLRAANRFAFDTLLKADRPLSLAQLTPDKADSLDTDHWTAAQVIALGASVFLSKPVAQDEALQMLVTYVLNHREIDRLPTPRRNEEAIRRVRSAIGVKNANGVGDLYDQTTDEGRKILDKLLVLADSERTDLSVYTLDCLLTPLDMEAIASDDASPADMLSRALLLMLLRAMRRDRDTALELYRDDKSEQIARMTDEAALAKAALRSADERACADSEQIKSLRARITALESENARLKSCQQEHAGDADELASLRSALYQSLNADLDHTTPADKRRRNISGRIVIIGGHGSWAKAVSEASGAEAYPTGTTCPTSVIADAAEVWFQAAYMAHSEYNAAVSIARARHIPVRYFSSTGISRSVDELLFDQD